MSKKSLLYKAESYLRLCYLELNKQDLFDERWSDVKSAIEKDGTYELLDFELDYGAKVAWRNSNKCIGRLFWKSMVVFDKRTVKSIDSVFEALFEHINYATNEGNIRSTITIFHNKSEIRIWNPQLLSFAGYEAKDGSIIGDAKNLKFTNECIKLGWEPKMGNFDVLPLVVKVGSELPVWRDIPNEIVKIVSLEHPTLKSFSALNLKWYTTPIISNMTLEIGGVEFNAAPFNGWYMGTEIGARNLSDETRYNMLLPIARLMNLNTNSKNNLWKDRALIELNCAVLHSFKKSGAKIVDHHTASRQYMQFIKKEQKEGREATGDWSWIVPPISGSTMEVFHTKMNNIENSPNYFYQKEPWD